MLKKITQRVLAISLAVMMTIMTPVSYANAADTAAQDEYEMYGESEPGSESDPGSEPVTDEEAVHGSEGEDLTEETSESFSEDGSETESDAESQTETEGSMTEDASEEEISGLEATEGILDEEIPAEEETASAADSEAASDAVQTRIEFHVGDGFIGEYTDDDIREYLESNYSEKELIAEIPDESEVELLGADSSTIQSLKTAMKARNTRFTYSDSSFDPEAVIKKAQEDTNETDPTGGDYLRGNMIGWSAGASSGGSGWNITITFVWTGTAAQEASVNTEVARIVNELDLKSKSKSDYDKVKDIHDYLVNTIDYVDDGTYHCHGTHAALLSKECVCQGYANAFTRLCREGGIPAKYIVGSKINHAWNIVKVVDDAPGCDPERPWYNMDVTWDDPVGGTGLYYTYFLKNNLDFYDHPRDSEYDTSSYNKKHPMALYSYGMTSAGYEAENNEYTLETIDGTTVTTKADGKPKFIIFFRTSCYNSQMTIKSLASSKMVKRRKVDVIAVDIDGSSAATVGSFRDTYAKGSNIDFVAMNKTNMYYMLSFYLGIASIRGSYTLPLMVMIDENDLVQFISQGRISADTLSELHMYYLKEDWDPDATTGSVQIRKYADAAAVESDTFTKVGTTLTVKYGDEFYIKGVGIPNKQGIKDFNPACTPEITDTNSTAEYDPVSGLFKIRITPNMQKNKSETVTLKFVSDYADDVSAKVKITVKPAVVSAISCDTKALEMITDQVETVVLEHTPAVTSDDLTRVVWTSSDENVATVTGSGLTADIKAGKTMDGDAVITAVYTNAAGKKLTAKIAVSVVVPIKLDKHELFFTSKPGVVSGRLTARATGIDPSDIKWASGDESIVTVVPDPDSPCEATVYPNDRLEAEVSVANITVSTKDDKYPQTCKVTVHAVPKAEPPAASVQKDGVTEAVPSGDTVKKVSIGTYLTLNSTTPGADLFFTTDGSSPSVDEQGAPGSENVLEYSDRTLIDKTMTIKAIAYKKGYADPSGAIRTFKFEIDDDDWGADLKDETEIKNLFDGKASEVPEGLWYVIDGKKYTDDGITEYKEVYTGEKITFDHKIEVFHGRTKLCENRDYTISYSNNTNAMPGMTKDMSVSEYLADKLEENAKFKAPSFTVKGKGYYKDKATFVFGIYSAGIENTIVTSGDPTCFVAGSKVKISDVKPVVAYNGKVLKLGKDYEVAGYSVYDEDHTTWNDITADEIVSEADHLYMITIQGKEGGNFGIPDRTKSIELKSVASKADIIKPAAKVKLSKAKIAGLATSVEYAGRQIGFDDLFKPDKVTKDPNGDKNETDAWKGVTLYVTDSKTKVKTPLVRFEEGAPEGDPFLTGDKSKADYTVEMTNNGSVGKFTLKFIGLNAYEGTVKKTITVKAYNVKNDTRGSIEIADIDDETYKKSGSRPSVTVDYVTEWNTDESGNRTTPKTAYRLREGIDYTLSYKNNVKPADKVTAGKKAPTVTVKGKGNFTGTNLTKTFTINKADAGSNIDLVIADVSINPKGKAGYIMPIPKITDNGKAVTAGKNKEIETIAKTAYRYTYAEDTELEDGTVIYKGTPVGASDKPVAGSRIRVEAAAVVVSDNSPYTATSGTVISGEYGIIGSGKDISKYSARIVDTTVLTYRHGDDVVPVKENNIEIVPKKGEEPLKVKDYEIVSVTNNRFTGTATVTVRGRNGYGGTKSFTFKITAASLK